MADTSIDELCHRAPLSASRTGGTDADKAQAHFDCGITWARIGAYEQALEAWRQALRIAPDPADVHAAMGSVYMTMGCWQEAVRSYQQAISAAPHLLESYYGLGSAYGRLGEYSRAVETYEQAFKLLPIERDQNREADVVRIDDPAAGALRPDPDASQDRLRSDTEGFDFSALLSSPAARRQAVRETQATVPPPATISKTHGTGGME